MGCLWSINAAEFSTLSPPPTCLAGDDAIPYHSCPRAVLTEPLATLLLQGGSFSEDKTSLLNFTFTPTLTIVLGMKFHWEAWQAPSTNSHLSIYHSPSCPPSSGHTDPVSILTHAKVTP